MSLKNDMKLVQETSVQIPQQNY